MRLSRSCHMCATGAASSSCPFPKFRCADNGEPRRENKRSRAVKVVLFCGGMGMRLREHAEALPKPIVPVGHRPIIWHVMKYYAYYGHKDFVLCLGYNSAVIKEYFLRYNEAISNDFVMSDGGRSLQLLGTDIQDWTITFADTGLNSNIGQRLKLVERY